MSLRPDKRKRTSIHRTRIDSGQSAASSTSDFLEVGMREATFQASTGRRIPAARLFVTDIPWLPKEDNEIGLDADGLKTDQAFTAEFDEIEARDEKVRLEAQKKEKKKKKNVLSSRPMVAWKTSYRDLYLDELLRWEGRGDAWKDGDAHCYDCRAQKVDPPGPGEYRCQDCFTPFLLCKSCLLRRHRTLPLHVIEKWTGSTFIKSSLKDLGLRIQLNHLGMKCSHPEPSPANFTILHNNGMHEVALDYCGCRPVPKIRQLLRRGLYPASQKNPRTCATFSLLRQLHMLSLTSKCSTYDFYRALERLTNNTGINMPRTKYRLLLRMIMQWRHLKLLKRAGRGHDESGPQGTKEGELAIACPSCPHPGINLPEDWGSASSEKSFLYFIVLCIDANFRLKNQLVSNYSVDPGLGIGLAYMVSRGPYEEYLKQRASDDDDEEEVHGSGCGLQAVEQANTKFSKGLRYTGVSSVSCGRSEMVMPCSVCNLQKGERYATMDYAYASVLRFVAVLLVIVSYDIVCQWFVNLARRINNYWPPELKPTQRLSMMPVIPKLHKEGHKKTGQHEQFSFNLCTGAGQTDGECPERIWAGHNGVASATKAMGPGSRQDVLDDHFGYWNYEKYVSMGKTLMRRYQKAVPERNKQAEAHRGFTASLNAKDVATWEKLCKEWDSDTFPKTADNPYFVEGTNLTQAQVLKELAEEEKEFRASDGASFHETSTSAFLMKGLALEDEQRRLCWLAKTKAREASVITAERQALQNQIEAWKKVQSSYMPGLQQHLKICERTYPNSTVDSSNVEEMRLWLPSSLPGAVRDRICVPGLSRAEEKLRTAQCADSLASIRDTLQLKLRMIQFKNKNIRGQREGTRSQELIKRIHNRARKYAGVYRAARAAKLELSGPGKWEEAFRVLQDADIRSYQDPERMRTRKRRRGTWEDLEVLPAMVIDEETSHVDEINLLPENRGKRDGSGRTRMSISWIWTVTAYNSEQPEAAVDNILRAEWAQSRARVHRSMEEVELLREEMRRVVAFLEWKASWWGSKQDSRPVQDVVLEEGLRSYSVDQQSRQLALNIFFKTIWKTPLETSIPSNDFQQDDNDSGCSDDNIDTDAQEDDDCTSEQEEDEGASDNEEEKDLDDNDAYEEEQSAQDDDEDTDIGNLSDYDH